jgi:2-polyprenyl-6-hydroxyphenyl methylase/3-demethylubiquinone-9 3-methyltransferase
LKTGSDISGYCYESNELSHAHQFLWPKVSDITKAYFQSRTDLNDKRIFDLGCGNGSIAFEMSQLGYSVSGVDPSVEGISQAQSHLKNADLRVGSAYDDLQSTFGSFPVVVSLEVVEHVYDPRHYARTLLSLVEPGGIAVVSTPYHGYFKNLAIALAGHFDPHFTALWPHGHIKFWSINTLKVLLEEAGFQRVRFYRVGRIPALARSMIAVAQKD